MNNQECLTQPTLINLHFNEYTQGLHYYPFAINLDGYAERSNTRNDPSNKVCVPNKSKDVGSIIYNSRVTCDEIVKEIKIFSTKTIQQKVLQ